MSRPSIVTAFLFGICLVQSCTPAKLDGPAGNRAPTARIALPSGPLLEGAELTFDGSGSSDPEGDSLKYLWDLGDGLSATEPVAKRSYYQKGPHAVTLIVTDQQGQSDTATTRVSVVNAP